MKETASQERTRNRNERAMGHVQCGPSGFRAAMKPDKPRRNGSCSTIFPFGLKAEFLAQQNRRPPPSFADASARSCRGGAGPARPTSFEPHPRDRRHEPKARGNGKRNEAMNTIAEFTIIGRVGEIRQVGTTLRVNIASSHSRKDNRGEWVERTRWNEVTVFGESSRGYVKRNIVKRSRLHFGLDGPNEVGEGRKNVLRRHTRLRTHRAPVQGPEPRRRQER
jgi:hypothetical protein